MGAPGPSGTSHLMPTGPPGGFQAAPAPNQSTWSGQPPEEGWAEGGGRSHRAAGGRGKPGRAGRGAGVGLSKQFPPVVPGADKGQSELVGKNGDFNHRYLSNFCLHVGKRKASQALEHNAGAGGRA